LTADVTPTWCQSGDDHPPVDPGSGRDRDPSTFAELLAAMVRTDLAGDHDEVPDAARAGPSP
jgi:hypothetical protein